MFGRRKKTDPAPLRGQKLTTAADYTAHREVYSRVVTAANTLLSQEDKRDADLFDLTIAVACASLFSNEPLNDLARQVKQAAENVVNGASDTEVLVEARDRYINAAQTALGNDRWGGTR